MPEIKEFIPMSNQSVSPCGTPYKTTCGGQALIEARGNRAFAILKGYGPPCLPFGERGQGPFRCA